MKGGGGDHIYIYMCVCILIYIYTHTRTHAYMDTYMHARCSLKGICNLILPDSRAQADILGDRTQLQQFLAFGFSGFGILCW